MFNLYYIDIFIIKKGMLFLKQMRYKYQEKILN